MVTFEEVSAVVGDVLQLGERARVLEPSTPLLGGMPEFDSMAVVTVITALEERYGIAIDDDEISAETFETMGNLHQFVKTKVEG